MNDFIKRNWIMPLLLVKAAFNAVVQVAWAFVSLGLLGWIFFYVKKEYPQVGLADMPILLGHAGSFIMEHSTLLIVLLTIVYFYWEYKETRRLQEVKK